MTVSFQTRQCHHVNDDDDDFCYSHWPLHDACRHKNLQLVQHLVQNEHFNVHARDAFDATPLYHASQVGATEICIYLLQHGAVCDDRVYHVALTSPLQRFLKQQQQQPNDEYPPPNHHWKCAFDNEEHADCIVYLKNDVTPTVYVHACMLQVSCPKLAALIQPNKEKENYPFQLQLSHHDGIAMTLVLQYLYTGVLETSHTVTARACLDICREYGLNVLETNLCQALLHPTTTTTTTTGRFHCHIETMAWCRQHAQTLARRMSMPIMTSSEQLHNNTNMTYLHVQNTTFVVHTFRLTAESQFFNRALKQGHWRESLERSMDTSDLFCNHTRLLQYFIQWLYCNAILLEEEMDVNVMIFLLELSIVILCPRFTEYIVKQHLLPAVTPTNVLELLLLSKMYKLHDLRDKCVQVMSCHVKQLLLVEDTNECWSTLFQQDATLVAEISRALSKSTNMTMEEKKAVLDLLTQKVTSCGNE